MKRLLKVTAMTGLLTLLRMAAGLVIAKVVATYTGPAGMAMLGQVQSMVMSLNGLVTAPSSSGLIRYTAQYHHQGFASCAPWWRASLHWVAILLACVVPFGLIFSKSLATLLFGNPNYVWLVWITVSVLPFSAMGTMVNSVINGQQLYRRYVGLGMLSVLISSCIMLTMIIIGNLEGALLAAAMQTGLIGCVMLLSSLRQPWFKLRYWWGKTGKKHKRGLGAYLLMALTSALTVPVSLILVRNILVTHVGWEQAGQWQAVWKISEIYLSVITMALSSYYLPRLSSLSDGLEIKREINRTAFCVAPIVAVIALSIYLSRDIIISLLFTEAFHMARDLFFVQLCGDFFKILGWLYAFPMVSKKLTTIYVASEVLFAAIFILLVFVLVRSNGLIGANVAYLISYFSYACIFVFIIKPWAR
jgi:O-antigen/teichoic acid export membrane protein